MCTVPQIFDDAEENGVKDFYWCIDRSIKSCQRSCPEDRSFDKHPPTVQPQEWIIYVVFVIVHPSQQFRLDIDRRPFWVVFTQQSSASYKFIDPVLGIRIFGTTICLLVLYILGYTQTSQFHLILDFLECLRPRTRNTGLWIFILSDYQRQDGDSSPRRDCENQHHFLSLVVYHQHGIFYMGDFHFRRCGRRLRFEQGCPLGHSSRRS